ncbi:MAG TPA: substrate-binding domain-containing protein [Chloroflexota bacterium]
MVHGAFIRRRSRTLVRLAVVFSIAATVFAVPHFNAMASSPRTSSWTIGVSNSLIGNGWRDEMVCSIRAEAKNSGKAHTLVQQTNGDTNQQIAQIRSMISQHVNAIIIDPNSSTALNSAILQAVSQHIVVVVVDQFIPALLNHPGVYQVANDQRAYGRLGTQWLVNQIHGKGNIAFLQGISGAPANTAREQGQQDVLKNHPKITKIANVYTGWVWTTGAQQITSLLNSGKKIDGVWTSGIDYIVANAYKTAHRKLVPVVGADNNGFVHQLLTMKGLVGAAVTNPPPVGGVGASIALKVLSGQHPPLVTTLTPKVWSNTTAQGRAALRAHYLPTRSLQYAADWAVAPYTNYTKQQLFACSG